MGLLVASAPLAGDPAAFPLLLVATAFVGLGFGLTVPTLNTFAAAFHPDRVIEPCWSSTRSSAWARPSRRCSWPCSSASGSGGHCRSCRWSCSPACWPSASACRCGSPTPQAPRAERSRIPTRFWLFAAAAVLYGICETMNGNWAQQDMTGRLGASAAVASLALTAFWGMVTVGRLLFAAVQRQFPAARAYRLLPFVLALALGLIAVLPDGSQVAGVLAFGLAGLGCSALLPLTISFGQGQLVTMSTAAAGAIIAFYQLGYGIAAFGTGPLQDAGVSLSTLFACTAVVALALGACAFVITSVRPSTT